MKIKWDNNKSVVVSKYLMNKDKNKATETRELQTKA